MAEQDQILQFMRLSGPTIPSKVAKHLKTEILFASAHLSDLVSQGKVKISYLKIGGTPLYYLSGQEAQLYPFAQGNLNPKDFSVLERLREEKILREVDQDLLTRVALREIKDFAIPLQVTTEGNSELFWKWHLLSEEETNQRLEILFQALEEPVTAGQTASESPSLSLQKEIPPTLSTPELPVSPEPASSLAPEIQQQLVGEKSIRKTIKSTSIKRTELSDSFLQDVERFLKRMDIQIEQKETIRKNAEVNFLVRVPSSVGETTYFCKARNKSKCDEKDLSTAYLEAQMKKLPLLFLYTNELHKKAQEMVQSNAFANVIVRKV